MESVNAIMFCLDIVLFFSAELSRYIASGAGQLSLAILPWVCTVSTGSHHVLLSFLGEESGEFYITLD